MLALPMWRSTTIQPLRSTPPSTASLRGGAASSPELLFIAGGRYYATRTLSLGCNISYAAGLYASPSIVRRSDRVIEALNTMGLGEAASEQEQLPNLLDISVSATKRLYISAQRVFIITARIDNL